ncbi:hypothetical protein VHUM_02842 [Vanrija humicola]|uniref:N-glycosylation protein EOS1 n=1 Tax=Vanrija humicola TaxID=5417 RepID=A0A7D8UY54_VANHU|nr:hypothetical protein VHUM_02842 [Vanrija humicola]
MARARGDLAPLSTITPIDIGRADPLAAAGAGAGAGATRPAPAPTPAPAPAPVPGALAASRTSPHQRAGLQLQHPPDVQPIPVLAGAPHTSRASPPNRQYPMGAFPGGNAGGAQQQQQQQTAPMPVPLPMPHRGATVPQPTPARAHGRSRSRSSPRSSISSGSETETEVDSDSTFVPGRVRHQHSRSQPDLSALRSRREVEGWADGAREAAAIVSAGGSAAGLVRRKSHGRKTPPPTRPLALSQGYPNGSSSSAAAASSAYASSSAPLGALGLRSVSPRQSTISIPHLTPITANSSPRSDPRSGDSSDDMSPGSSIRSPIGGMTGSEDADDDFGSNDSPSSGSISFSPKYRRRNRPGADEIARAAALGLLLDPGNSADEQPRRSSIDLKAASIEARLRRSTFVSFRLLAVVPALWGISVLGHALATGSLWHDVWPWGVDFSREALDRLVAGTHAYEGIQRPVNRGDMALAILWALLTAHFCFSLATGLSYRWRSYYSPASTMTRLISLQCLCWPATYTTLWVLGPKRPLLAWVVIGVTTAVSRTIQMWVTSNVIVDDTPGDITPGPFRRISPPPVPPPAPPAHLSGWEAFVYGRTWDWEKVARKVGWKVGFMLLVTCAWLFWRIDNGWGAAPGWEVGAGVGAAASALKATVTVTATVTAAAVAAATTTPTPPTVVG